MSSILQIKRRLQGAPGSPPEAGSIEGELAVNMQAAGTPEMYIFGGNTATGTAPANKGWLRLNPSASIDVVSKTITGTTSPAVDGNGQAAAAGQWPWTVTAGQVPIVTHDGTAYAFTGGVGSWGTTAGGSALTAAMFTPLGASPGAPQVTDLSAQNAAANIGAAWTAAGATAGTGLNLASWNGQVYILTNPSVPANAASWTPISQDVTTEVIDWTALAGNPADLGAAYTAWNTGAGTPDLTASINIVKYGSPAQYFLLTDPANPSVIASYSALGAPIPPALTYQGNLDVEAAMAGTPLATWNAGDFATAANTAGDAQGTDFTPEASWPLAGVAGNITVGDLLIYDGTNLNVVSVDIDLTTYVSKSGANAIAADMVMTWTAPTADGTTIFDGGNPVKSKIDNVQLDAGTY